MTECKHLGPTSGTEHQCQHAVLCMMTALGEPPSGTYFWLDPVGEHDFKIQICFNREDEKSVNYAQAVMLTAPEKWEDASG